MPPKSRKQKTSAQTKKKKINSKTHRKCPTAEKVNPVRNDPENWPVQWGSVHTRVDEHPTNMAQNRASEQKRQRPSKAFDAENKNRERFKMQNKSCTVKQNPGSLGEKSAYYARHKSWSCVKKTKQRKLWSMIGPLADGNCRSKWHRQRGHHQIIWIGGEIHLIQVGGRRGILVVLFVWAKSRCGRHGW